MTKSNFISPAEYKGLHFFNESGITLPVDASALSSIIEVMQTHERCSFALVEAVFVDENEIVRINREYLDHHYVTDIITFRHDESPGKQSVEGTLYCCAQRIREQARELNHPPGEEYARILIHGLLHLIGYDDKSDEDRSTMRKKEDFYLRNAGY